MKTVYILSRAGAILNVYDTLEKAREQFPGKWEEGPHRNWVVPDSWILGDASILKMWVLEYSIKKDMAKDRKTIKKAHNDTQQPQPQLKEPDPPQPDPLRKGG